MVSEYKTTNPELAILGLIAEKSVYGYEVEQIVEQRGMRQWTEIGFSSIYHILNKLKTIGVLSDEVQSTGSRPARRVFRITHAGMRVLQDEIRRRLSSPRAHSSDMDLVLANWMLLPQSEILAGLRAQRQYLALRLELVQAKWQSDRQYASFPPSVNELFDHTCHNLKAEIEWLETCLSRYTEK
jgi:DNA-binding PadR family transcriptional regulator